MNERMNKTVTVVKEKWTGLPRARKIVLIVLLAAIVIVVIAAIVLTNRTNFVKLYDSMEQSTAAEIVTAVQELGFEAEMRSDGSVYVPKGTENTIAMQLAVQGYPQDNIAYDAYINNVDMFSTESEKQEYLRQATEQRMSAIIGTLDGIESATVQLAIPLQQNTVITTFRQQPVATVIVYLRSPESQLSSRQIQGIKNIVRAANPGLTDENITIQDGAGIPQISTEDTGGTDVDKLIERLLYKTRLEKDLQEKIDALLLPIYGDGGFTARVNLILNFDTRADETVNYSAEDTDNNTGVVSSENSANASGTTTADGNVAGEEPNTEQFPEGTEAGEAGSWTDNSNSVNYLVDVYRSQVVKDGYDVDGLSIAVAIYTDFLTPAQIDTLRGMISNAAGVAPEVSEQVVSVANFAPFVPEDLESEEQPDIFFGLTLNHLIIAGAILVILLIVMTMFMVLRNVTHKKRQKAFEKRIIESGHFDMGDVTPNEIEKTLFMLNKDKPEAEIPSLLDDGVETKEIIIRKEIANFARHSPEIVAALLRNWMTMSPEEMHKQDMKEHPKKE
ncbi:MAG: flagellar M-ring protein FliF [Ruminococcus sp.]|jgi:flagellar M-ring protein FliF|nr:flagellar M-ring protein FliF [Ruminococcus sp.]